MASRESAEFLTGVIEGFYGKPWTLAERFELFDGMMSWGLNSYLYAPKDDLKHRAIWRERYSESEREMLEELIHGCTQRGIRFFYALGPGLDIRYSDESDLNCLQGRFEQMLAMGCRHFALLFDDIPDQIDPADLKRWGSLAAAQSQVANAMFEWVRERAQGARFLFCPTPYCGRMAERKLGGEAYLSIIGCDLLPEVDVLWTGPEIVSREITVAHAREVQTVLRRKPLIWDNLHANDYDGRRFYCGPYTGRSPELRGEVSGILVNPNNEGPLNHVPLRTFAQYLHCDGQWDARRAYLSAMREWLAHFETVGQPVGDEDMILFGDCYYLPHEQGPLADAFCRSAEKLLAAKRMAVAPEFDSFLKTATRLRDFCVRMSELRDRPLFYALSRRVWELREELDLLLACVRSKAGNPNAPCRSDSHLAGTYRGGIVPRLQRMLVEQPDGSYVPPPTAVP